MEQNYPNKNNLLNDLVSIIEQGKRQAVAQVNSALTLVFWQVRKRINEDILQNERAVYGKQVVNEIAKQLVHKYGRIFKARNIRRMI